MADEQLQQLASEEALEGTEADDQVGQAPPDTLDSPAETDDDEKLDEGHGIAERFAVSEELERRSFIASDETEVGRFYGRLILGHRRSEVRLERHRSRGGMPFLEDHVWNQLRGRVLAQRLRQRQLHADVALSSSAETVAMMKDVNDGIRPGISVGVWIYKMKLIEEDTDNRLNDLFRAVDWEPMEDSSVTIPANRNVGFAQFSLGGTEDNMTMQPAPFHSLDAQSEFNAAVEARVEHEMAKLAKMSAASGGDADDQPGDDSGQKTDSDDEEIERESAPQGGKDIKEDSEKESSESGTNQSEESREEDGTVTMAVSDAVEIIKLGKVLSRSDEALDAVVRGETYQAFSDRILAEQMANTPNVAENRVPAQARKDTYNLANVIRLMIAPENETLREVCGYESQMSADLRRGDEMNNAEGGFVVPMDIAARPGNLPTQNILRQIFNTGENLWPRNAQQTFAVSSADAAEMVRTAVAEVQLPFQEDSPVLGGCRVLTGLVGDLSIPNIARVTPTSVAEGANAANTEPAVAGPKLSPKTLAVKIPLTNLSIHQSDNALLSAVVDVVREGFAFEFDTGIIAGTGASNQVRGITATSGVDSITPQAGAHVDATSLNWTDVTELEAGVAKNRKVMPNGMVPGGRYMLPPQMNAICKRTLKATGRQQFIREGNGPINDYPVIVSNAVPYNAVTGSNNDIKDFIFGDLMEVWVGFWADLQLIRDLVTNPGTTILSWQIYWDVAIPRPSGFSRIRYDGGS